ncbi:Multidrug and toxin extrusion protein [Schistosoma japonicum]|uniref:Multidrug and toxin extrusion protein n=1 Tax=Schistosoma japonicum TaxID=6182 RepID=A0A4Z2DL78_SCHJA|nr:Multidrug and toxin extrusion protein [Schistosoma japonicum]
MIDLFKKDTTIDGTDDQEELRTLTYRQRLLKKFYPLGFLHELKNLLRLAVPITISSMLTFTISPVSMAFCGHLGKIQLATIGLAMSVFSVCGMFVILGLLSACDTLFSQTYGSTMKSKMIVQLYRAIILILLCCIPSCALYLNAEPLLLLLGQNPLIAKGTGELLLYFIPALLFSSLGQLLIKFVQTQNHVYAPLVIMIFVNGINALMHYVLIYLVNMDVRASPISQTIAYGFEVVCFVVYVKFLGLSKDINFKITMEIWEDWSTWFRLAIPGLIMVSLEWTIYEIGGFIAGTLGARELAAQTIILTIGTMSYTLLPLGVGSAAGIRVGQYLGAKSAKGPYSVFSVALTLVGCWALPYVGILIVTRWYLPRVFTSDYGVIELVAELMPIISYFQIIDGVNGVCSGVLKGSGLQTIGAIVNIFCLYMLAAPLGICLVYLVNLRLHGIWIGLVTAATIQVSTLCTICFRLNWTTQIKLALERIKVESDSLGINMQNINELNSTGILKIDDDTHVSEVNHKTNSHTEANTELSNKRNTQGTLSNKKLIRNRIMLIFILFLLLITSILCRIFINLSDYFGIYCVYNNDTYIQITNFNISDNCTVVIP